MRRAVAASLVVAMLVALDGAYAAWTVNGSGSARATAVSMGQGNQPTAAASGRQVSVVWTASTYSNGAPVGDYSVKRYDSGGNGQNVGANCSGTVSGLSCTESDLSPGTWRYSVTPRAGSWRGSESPKSAPVTVGSAKLTLSPTSPSSLPATLTGQVSDFLAGQTVTFRLDDPSNGTQLSSTVSPSPIPSDGKANVTVTVPNDVAGGLHTVYAVGSKGDVASQAITLASPSLTFSSSTTITSLPSTLNGSVANFRPDQTVAFRLDDASGGTVLTGTVNPSPIGSNRQANITVTIPAGTANGSHTVYAIGSKGDVASAAITVNALTARSVSTSGYALRDASSGTAADASWQPAFVDGRTAASLAAWPTSFSTGRYEEFNMSQPLPSSLSVQSPVFNLTFASATASTTCAYFEVRRASTGAVLSTHGSTASPVSCATGTTQTTSSTAIPVVTTSDLADDLRIRVFFRNTASAASTLERATVSGTASSASTPFTLYPASATDTSGTAATYPWALETADSPAVASTFIGASGFDTAFNTAKYLQNTFPGYVPGGASAISGSLKTTYRGTSGASTCWYFDVRSGGSVIGTHGSAAAPVSCNATTTFVTDTVNLPEVDTVAEANDVTVRLYFKSAGNNATNRRVELDQSRLTIAYGN